MSKTLTGSKPKRSLQDWKRKLIWLAIQTGGQLRNECRLNYTTLRYQLLRQTPLFSLNKWYGGTGNNIQQMLLGACHAARFRGKFFVNEAQLKEAGLSGLFKPILIDFSSGKPATAEFCSNFFHFTEYTFDKTSSKRMHFLEGCLPRRECLISRQWTEKNIHQVALTELRKHLITPAITAPNDDHIVIWIRSGELADLSYSYYMTNPLHFYRMIAAKYRNAFIVTQASANHILLESIIPLFDSASVERLSFDDEHRDRGFEILRQARNMATSGVSTFPLAAALLSDKLQNFHYSDAFMAEHLNPLMLDPDRVNLHKVSLPGYEKQWRLSSDRPALLRTYSPS